MRKVLRIIKKVLTVLGTVLTVILTVLDRKGFIKLKGFIKKEDPAAFITVNETSAVFGQGFTSLLD